MLCEEVTKMTDGSLYTQIENYFPKVRRLENCLCLTSSVYLMNMRSRMDSCMTGSCFEIRDGKPFH